MYFYCCLVDIDLLSEEKGHWDLEDVEQVAKDD